jgi:hypothetical protein
MKSHNISRKEREREQEVPEREKRERERREERERKEKREERERERVQRKMRGCFVSGEEERERETKQNETAKNETKEAKQKTIPPSPLATAVDTPLYLAFDPVCLFFRLPNCKKRNRNTCEQTNDKNRTTKRRED